ncbi:MAG TPA: UDP-glucose/GDP-mannose dehydrogenase family protein [Candidatus Krumholzibacteria bacterium]|nr:UDP-glucose/GDP-mannose dehydrogenase family protein [Candidatus Krumholzibacteria bacterium]
MRISIVGAGYVGLVTGVCLAEKGHDVVCVETDAAKVERINRAEAPIHETGLEALLARHVGKRFRATRDMVEAVVNSDVTFVAVGTPFDGRSIDLTHVLAAAEQIGAALAGKDARHTVIVKSTVVPGTTVGPVREHLEAASGKRAGSGFGLGANPEFLTEGQAVEDFMQPDRIVIGGIDAGTLSVLADVYRPFADVPVIRSNPSTAEMIKYASNALLATAISFSNEIADLCSALGDVDARDVMRGVHESAYLTVRRNGERLRAPLAGFFEAGCGFGGSCLPKDVNALAAHGRARGIDMPLLDAVMAVNAGRPRRVLELLERHFPELAGRRIAVLGLAFKPDTDDVRESPAFPVIRALVAAGATVSAYDPVANEPARRALGDLPVRYAGGLGDAVAGADAVVIVTRWAEFGELPDLLRASGAETLVVDGRRMLERDAVEHYDGIGL